jgi:hypothetical protein
MPARALLLAVLRGTGRTRASVPRGPTLLSAATKRLESLPNVLPGTVCRQWVRCGRPDCHCAHGQLHGPYHYRLWREGGRLRKQYVRPRDLARVVAACEARRQLRRDVEAGWEEFRGMLDTVRQLEGA